MTGPEARRILAGTLVFGDPSQVAAITLLERIENSGKHGHDLICQLCEDPEKFAVPRYEFGGTLCAKCASSRASFSRKLSEDGGAK